VHAAATMQLSHAAGSSYRPIMPRSETASSSPTEETHEPSIGRPRRADPMVLRISSDLGRLAEVRVFVRAAAARNGFAGEAIDDIVQAVDESVTNVIRHGDRTPGGRIVIEVDRGGPALVVRVRDRSRAFDPTAVPTRDLPRSLEDGLGGGLGIPLIRQAVDEVHHRPLEGRGNELTLVKWLTGTDAGGGDDGDHD
jgi:anti-sigma regulatory factor (Ser/Thr protein kinase)